MRTDTKYEAMVTAYDHTLTVGNALSEERNSKYGNLVDVPGLGVLARFGLSG